MEALSRAELSSRLRREFVRYHFRVEAKIVWPSRAQWGCVTNISRGGMFIEIADPPSLNSHFSAYLALDVPLRLDCVVRRVVPRSGVGVTLSVPEEGRGRFKALLLALGHGSAPTTTSASIPKPESPRAMAVAAGTKRC